LKLELVSGHLLLPIDHWDKSPGLDLPSKQQFIDDKLGLKTWFVTPNGETSDFKDFENHIPSGSSVLDPGSPVLDPEIVCETSFNKEKGEGRNKKNEIDPPPGLPSLIFAVVPPTLDSSQLSGPANPLTKKAATSALVLPTLSSKVGSPKPTKQVSKSHAKTQPRSFLGSPVFVEEDETRETRQQYLLAGGMTAWLRTMRKATKPFCKWERNQTYKAKYAPLPAVTTVPHVDLPVGKWQFWEWWSGKGNLTRQCRKEGLKCGPPISHETGWCLMLAPHRRRLKELLLEHEPAVLFGAPLCSPWSQANTTMDWEFKQDMRKMQLEVFQFFHDCCHIQAKYGRAYAMEQPRASELRQQSLALNLPDFEDYYLCMCCHELRDPVSNLLYMKATAIRATKGLITPRTARWCTKDHEHETCNGFLPGGMLRTAYAQSYTTVFCKRFARAM
jgi:hypothetical protein